MPDEIMFLAEGIEAAIISTNGLADSDACPSFAGYNLLDRCQNTPWKAGSGSTHFIRIDMGADYTASAIALINANPLTGGAYSGTKWRMELKSDDNWAFSSPTTRLAIQVPAAGDVPFWYEEFTEATDRYWRLTVYDPTDCVCKIGTLLLGTPYKSDLPYHRPRPMRSSYGIDVRETKGGHRHSNLRFEDRKIWRRADFDVLTEEDWDDLFQYLWQASKGGHYPCLFRDVDDSLNWIRVNAGRGTLDYQESLNHFFQAPFVFEQEF
jgi:hypothetical protein